MSKNPFSDSPKPPDSNPYASPMPQSGLPSFASTVPTVTHKLLNDFRSQMHALGGAWIFFGLLGLGLGGALLFAGFEIGQNNGDLPPNIVPIIGMIAVGVGAVHLFCGIATCFKILPAVYVGLVLAYISVILNAVNYNLCVVGIYVAIIIQAHRVINFAGKLGRAGIPLTAKPEQLSL